LAQDGSYNINPMSFTVMGSNSDMVLDNNTGLTWQRQDDGNTYNGYQASGTYDATYNPSSQNVCGSLNLAGFSDWLLPTKKELMSIVDYSIPYPGPTINSAYFPNTKSYPYWVSTTSAYWGPVSEWLVHFGYGYVNTNWMYQDRFYVRCVRGGQPAASFTDNGNGTVTDNKTGLVWQQSEPGYMTWDSALSYCEGLSLGDKTDWRLPNIKELESITDDARANPAIDTSFFPGPYGNYYWSSSTIANSSNYAWFVGFFVGEVNPGYSKSNDLYVRCVRGL
jgi:hypothetical protein